MERNKASMDTLCTKISKLNKMMKMQEGHERLRGLVNSWLETKLKEREKECHFMDEWRRRNNVLIFGIEEYPHKTYFDTLKITGKLETKTAGNEIRTDKLHD
jgi:hypothetical protein